MIAVVYAEFGPPDVLHLKEVEEPIAKDNEVLIRNCATTVTAEDPELRGAPGLNGFGEPTNPIRGIIESCGLT